MVSICSLADGLGRNLQKAENLLADLRDHDDPVVKIADMVSPFNLPCKQKRGLYPLARKLLLLFEACTCLS